MPDSARTVEAIEPYPGLRFYEPNMDFVFAGRDKEVTDCARAIQAANVVVVHGRTGCGKSSFLRAGVKPLLQRRSDLGLQFAIQEGFRVIQSTGMPLRRFGEELLLVADSLKDGSSAYGPVRSSEDRQAVVEYFGDEKKRTQIVRKANAAFEALTLLTKALEHAPIFVIDQAEEVFTLNPAEIDTPEAGEESESAVPAEGSLPEYKLETEEYFRFVHAVGARGGECKLVISLRTEYKGQFDDRIAKYGQSSGLRGFYLDRLKKGPLLKAILRPTMEAKDPDWRKMVANGEVPPDLPAPFEQFRFKFADGVADKLATSLLMSKVPAGGVLPAMQVACLRLWRQARDANEGRDEITIEESQLRQLGEIPDQVAEFLEQSLEDACLESKGWMSNQSWAVDRWHRVLARALVKLEPDGRAVSKSIDAASLIKSAKTVLAGAPEAKLKEVVRLLTDKRSGILREDERAKDKRVMLGHDFLALALSKWQAVFDHTEMSMMGMEMGAGKSAAELDSKSLFVGGDLPHVTKVIVPMDYQWDRQLPLFAQKKGFGSRLGIEFETDLDHLSALNRTRRGKVRNWESLRAEIVKREKKYSVARDKAVMDRRHAREEGDIDEQTWELPHRVMVAAEWSAFPGEKGTGGDLWDPKEHAWKWSDLLVTDLFIGLALLGPPGGWDPKLALCERADRKQLPSLLRAHLKKALDDIVEQRGKILCYDESGVRMLKFAATVSGASEFTDYIKERKGESPCKTLIGAEYSNSDPLVSFLLNRKGEREARYIVGTAFARAMGEQCGFEVRFGSKHVAAVGQHLMESRANGKSKAGPEPGAKDIAVKDIAAELQAIVQHTLWQVSLPASQWDQGLNRAFMLRLASVGYYTAEYVRTHADEFVMHLQEFNNEIFESAEVAATDSVRGLRLNRKAIRDAVRSCYQFLKFEAYGYETYDLDNPYAYWSNHGELQTKSIAGEIYSELVRLRQLTITHFDSLSRSISWLRYRGAYNPRNEDISKAFKLKSQAWNNFRILNFYDAERYMSEAARVLQRRIEAEEGEGRASV